MKIEQDQIKKIGACFGVFGVLLYGYFAYLLGPLKDGERKSVSGIASLEPQIADAKEQITKTADLERKAPVATAFLNNIKNTIPSGEPIAWFPPKMTAFFKSHGIDKCTTHMMSETQDSMPGFKRITWAIDVPKVEFIPLGAAIASLENDEPLLTVLNVSIDAAREDAQFQHATLILSTLVKS